MAWQHVLRSPAVFLVSPHEFSDFDEAIWFQGIAQMRSFPRITKTLIVNCLARCANSQFLLATYKYSFDIIWWDIFAGFWRFHNISFQSKQIPKKSPKTQEYINICTTTSQDSEDDSSSESSASTVSVGLVAEVMKLVNSPKDDSKTNVQRSSISYMVKQKQGKSMYRSNMNKHQKYKNQRNHRSSRSVWLFCGYWGDTTPAASTPEPPPPLSRRAPRTARGDVEVGC